MSLALPARPSLEHLRGQAKSLLADFKRGDRTATKAFTDHLPNARDKAFKLADAQSVVARQHGFASWKALTRHVELLRSLEGTWQFESLEVDGQPMPAAMLGHSRMLFDGDRFRMESPEGNYDGHFTLDTAAQPMPLDIAFVEGPEAGNSAYAIWQLDDDALTICLGLVGSPRPAAFETSPGSGHALEKLRRASTARPVGVKGGTPQPRQEAAPASAADTTGFDLAASPLLTRLEGEWAATRLVAKGEEMRSDWLSFGSRTAKGNEVKVIFGGQVMVHARVRIDESVSPIAIDYLHLAGAPKGKVSLGIMEWVGDEACFLMAAPGQSRPTDFSKPSATQTLSQWRRKG